MLIYQYRAYLDTILLILFILKKKSYLPVLSWKKAHDTLLSREKSYRKMTSMILSKQKNNLYMSTDNQKYICV